MATKTYKVEIDVESKTLGQLEDELAQVNEELKDVDRNSEAFKTLSKEAQALTAEIEKTNNEIEGLKLEDKLMAADGAAKVFGGSLASVVGTLGVLGVESEAFGEFEKKAASAIAVGLGVKDVAEGFGNLSLVMKKSGIAAKLFGSTTSKALVATGIGAFVVALGLVVANFDEITKAAKRFANSVPFIGKAIEGVKKMFDKLFDAARPVLEFLGILPDEAERAAIALEETTNKTIQKLERELAVLQAAGATEEMIYEKRMELMKAELSLLKQTGAEKEEIYKKETEMLALEAAERKRIRDAEAENVTTTETVKRREVVATVNTLTAKGLEQLEVEGIKLENLEIINHAQRKLDEDLLIQQLANIDKLNQAKAMQLDNLIAIAGAETKVGRGLLIAKQILAAKELIMEAKKTVTFATLKASESTVAIAAGTAKTAAVGFPQNIPLLIAYAVQAAGIIAAVVSAVRGAKKAGKGVGGDIPTPSTSVSGGRGATPAAPSLASQAQAPAADVCPTPAIRAYVLSGDARNGLEADARLNNRRTLG